jgi:hypothetical protein
MMNYYDEINKIEMIKQPELYKTNLYPHQLTSIYNMEKLEKEQNIILNENERKETKIGILSDISGYGKCLAKGTNVIMYDGSIKKVEDILENELLMGDDSLPRKVLSITNGIEEMYLIKQEYGISYTVNKAHILSLKYKPLIYNIKNRYYKIYYLINTKEYNTKELKCILKYKIINNKEKLIKLKKKYTKTIDIDIETYNKLDKKIRKRLYGYNTLINFNKININENNNVNVVNDFNDIINNIENVKIKKEYICNNIDIRLEILKRLIQNIEEKKYIIKLKRNNINIDNIKYIISSLGLKYKYKINDDIIEIEIIDKNNYLNLYLTKNLIKSKNISTTKIDIIKTKIDNYYGFTIDGNRRFLLEDFTVTHNTASVIGMLVRDKIEDNLNWNKNNKYEYENIKTETLFGQIKTYTKNRYNKINTTLILVPSVILTQWEKELSNTNLKYISIKTKKDIEYINVEEYDVVLVIPTMYNNLIMCYYEKAWKRFIYDEPGNVRVTSMKQIIAGFYWLITATPENIIINHKNCRTSFMLDMLGGSITHFENSIKPIIIKNDIEFIKQSFNMPKTNSFYYNCFQPIINNLHTYLDDNIISLIEAGDIENAIITLGGKSSDDILSIICKNKEDELVIINSMLNIFFIRRSEKKIKEWTDKKNKILFELNDLNIKFNNRLNEPCIICYNQLTEPVLEPKCQNIFCGKCLLYWLKEKLSCPLCRNIINTQDLVYFNNHNITNSSYNKKNIKNRKQTKEETILEIIKKNVNGKYLIFSNYEKTFDLISNILKENNINFLNLKGTLKNKEQIINKYKNDQHCVLFLNSLNHGVGLNLQETTDIIIYHDMSNSNIQQLIGRANRIGRLLPLNIHYLQIDK